MSSMSPPPRGGLSRGHPTTRSLHLSAQPWTVSGSPGSCSPAPPTSPARTTLPGQAPLGLDATVPRAHTWQLTWDPSGRSEGRRAGRGGSWPRRVPCACVTRQLAVPSCPDGRACSRRPPRRVTGGGDRGTRNPQNQSYDQAPGGAPPGVLSSPGLRGPGPTPSRAAVHAVCDRRCTCVLLASCKRHAAGSQRQARLWVAPRAEPAAPASTLTPTLTALQLT